MKITESKAREIAAANGYSFYFSAVLGAYTLESMEDGLDIAGYSYATPGAAIKALEKALQDA